MAIYAQDNKTAREELAKVLEKYDINQLMFSEMKHKVYCEILFQRKEDINEKKENEMCEMSESSDRQ